MKFLAIVAALSAASCASAAADRQKQGGSVSATADRSKQAAAGSGAQGLTIVRGGSLPSVKGPEANFTGSVRVDPLFQPTAPARASGAYVTFEPGARSAWHKHPLGQTLVVTAGTGRIQRRGGPVQELKPGDVVYTPPNEMHWHGASPITAMTHLSISELLDGKSVEWFEKVTDAEYLKQP